MKSTQLKRILRTINSATARVDGVVNELESAMDMPLTPPHAPVEYDDAPTRAHYAHTRANARNADDAEPIIATRCNACHYHARYTFTRCPKCHSIDVEIANVY